MQLAFDTETMQRLRARVELDFLTAARAAVGTAGRLVELDLEQAYEQAGAGRLARAWNTQVYPKRGLAEAPTADVRGKGKARTLGALRAFARGARIRPKDGDQYLAIPLPAAGPRYFGRGKVAIGPEEWQRRTGLRLDVAKIGGRLYLVTQGVRSKKTGRIARKATQRRLAQGRAVERLLIFLLIDGVDFQQRVNIDAIKARGPRYLDNAFTAEVNALLARQQGDGG
jgi:hypothetical protein